MTFIKFLIPLALILSLKAPAPLQAEKAESPLNKEQPVLEKSPADGMLYKVKNNENIEEIAKKEGVPLTPLKKKYKEVQRGQKIVLPKTYTQSEKDLLARLVNAEAKGEPYKGKLAVANVVLNRTKHKAFPATVKGVILEKKQFTPVANGEINKPASAEAKKAANEAIALQGTGKIPAEESIYFYNPDLTDSKWMRTLTVVNKIGQHTFAK
ncbi:cell wall hydrolase [Peribacillus sp. SCS-37]|uniref:cell wall hydrolase n=1 Tax=Paraperibacillus esterisolvens TaxID=3115296 RepID=UPI003906132D